MLMYLGYAEALPFIGGELIYVRINDPDCILNVKHTLTVYLRAVRRHLLKTQDVLLHPLWGFIRFFDE